jgi:predicted transcriptional regulator
MIFNMPPAAPTRARTYRVRSARQIEALATPARQEVVDGLAALGSASIAELAAHLGRAPDSLYYHVRKLVKVGLVEPRGLRGEGPRAEAVYATPQPRVVLDWQPSTPRERASLLRLLGSLLRITERDLKGAFEAGLARFRRGPRRNTWGGRVKGRLTHDEIAEVRGHVEAITTLLAGSAGRASDRSGELVAFTFVLTPLVPSPRARGGRGAPASRRSES